MFKKLSLVLAIALVAPFLALAEEETLPASGLTPDSSFYFLEQAWESVSTFFTFNSETKTERLLKLAEERLAEAKVLAENTEKSALAEKALARYEKFVEKVTKQAEKAEKVEVRERVAEATGKHLNIL